MPSRPLHISIYKIKLGSRNSDIHARMDAGQPGPIEESFMISERTRRENENQREIEAAFRKGYQIGLKDR
jgi:hypothetical protein